VSTIPPEQQGPPPSSSTTTPSSGTGYTGLGRTPVTGAILPVPGNAELAIWFVIEVILAIIAAVASDFDAHGWAVATTWLTAAYLISRGIAKASRVLEQ
jgi:hypothetical protein